MKNAFKSHLVQEYVLPNKNQILLGVFLIATGKLSGLVLPGAIKYLINNVIGNKEVHLLQWILIVAFCAVIVQSLCSVLLVKYVTVTAHKKIACYRKSSLKKVLLFPMLFFYNNQTSTLPKRIMDDLDGLKVLIGNGLIQLIGCLITIIGAVIILFFINVKFAVLVVIPLAIILLTSFKVYNYLLPLFRDKRKMEASTHGLLSESLQGMEIIKIYNAENSHYSAFAKSVNKIYKYQKKALISHGLYLSLSSLILGLTFIFIIWRGTVLVVEEVLLLGDFVAFLFYLGVMISPVSQLSKTVSALTEAIAGLDRTYNLLKNKVEYNSKNQKTLLKKVEGHISFNNVSYSYVTHLDAIKNLTIDIQPLSTVAIIGPSGSGKSTFARLLAGLIIPDKGTIKIDGIALESICPNSYRDYIGMVSQNDFFFKGSIRDNILLSKPNASGEELKSVIEAAQITEFTNLLAKGIDSEMGPLGNNLSSGQKQRVSIARCLLADPKIIILDEATAFLDIENEMLVQLAMENLLKDKTSIIITHQLDTIKKANQVFVLEKGTIVESGTHDELYNIDGFYSNYLNLQSKI